MEMEVSLARLDAQQQQIMVTCNETLSHSFDLRALLPGKISPLTRSDAGASCWTRSQVVPSTVESSWARHEMVINVPQQARSFHFDLGTKEQGKLWLDGIELAVVDTSVALTGTLLRPPSAQPLNLDFSEGGEYWAKVSGSLGHYEIAIDATIPPCATLKSTGEAPIGSCLLQQMLISGES